MLMPAGVENVGVFIENLKIKIYKNIILPVVLYGFETWSLTFVICM